MMWPIVGNQPLHPELPIGHRIGSLRVVRVLGKGAMGVVYEAVHEQIGQRVAIKVLRVHLSADPLLVARFLNEARGGRAVDRVAGAALA